MVNWWSRPDGLKNILWSQAKRIILWASQECKILKTYKEKLGKFKGDFMNELRVIPNTEKKEYLKFCYHHMDKNSESMRKQTLSNLISFLYTSNPSGKTDVLEGREETGELDAGQMGG